MRHSIVTFFIIMLVIGCTDDDSGIPDIRELRGNWVEIKKTTDTLSFATLFDDKELMYLKRAELYRSGPYEYKLLPDERISIHWMLAGSMSFEEYYFEVSGDRLMIGNFYESPSGEILIFRKID